MSPIRCFTFVLSSSALSLVGCHDGSGKNSVAVQPPEATDAPASQWTVQPVAHTETLPVKEGNPPLFYLVESAGSVRVVDATNGDLIGETTAPAQSIVAIDAARGVSVGGVELKRGALPAHRYAIYLNAGSASEFRTGIERNKPSILSKQNKSATQPVGATSAPSSP